MVVEQMWGGRCKRDQGHLSSDVQLLLWTSSNILDTSDSAGPPVSILGMTLGHSLRPGRLNRQGTQRAERRNEMKQKRNRDRRQKTKMNLYADLRQNRSKTRMLLGKASRTLSLFLSSSSIFAFSI